MGSNRPLFDAGGKEKASDVFESSDNHWTSRRGLRTAESAERAAGRELHGHNRRNVPRQAGAEAGAVEWHHVVAFARLAETCKEYLKKGRQVYVEGRLRTREYEAKNNGGRRQRTEIVASRVQFLGAPPAGRADAAAIEEPPIPSADEVPF